MLLPFPIELRILMYRHNLKMYGLLFFKDMTQFLKVRTWASIIHMLIIDRFVQVLSRCNTYVYFFAFFSSFLMHLKIPRS